MCGIIGYSGTGNAVPVLLEGLHSLEYRGYDSAGIALSKEGYLAVIKAAGRLSVLKEKTENMKDLYANCGIGHTRWATHGEPTDVNSHPHGTPRVSVVHNGIIENHEELKKFLEKNDYVFMSDTDTEAAAKLIDYYYCKNNDPVYAFTEARKHLKGSFAICALFYDRKGTIYAMRKESPLIAATSDIGCFAASDIPAVLKYTNKYYRIDEDEICVITGQEVSFIGENGEMREKIIESADFDTQAAEKGGYAHFMIKEIHEEPEAVIKTLRPRVKDGVVNLDIPELTEEKIRSFERIHISACGTAMHAGLIGKFAIEKMARIPVNVEIASEFRYKDPIIGENDLVIIISQSGETADTLAALRLAKQMGAYTLAIVNVSGSSIAREAHSVLYTWAGPEIAVASTKAFTVQIALMYFIALLFARATGRIGIDTEKTFTGELVSRVPEMISKALEMEGKCAKIAKKYKDSQSIFFIGRGIDFYLGEESALKLKEISYIHCESYAAGELKHGTISLVTDGTPVFALISSEDTLSKMISNIKEVKARGAKVFLMCKESISIPDGLADDIIEVPALSDLFMPFTMAAISQIVAYYASYYLGYDVDKPRNLAKSVTVE